MRVGTPELLWEGPGIRLDPIPGGALSHRNVDQLDGR